MDWPTDEHRDLKRQIDRAFVLRKVLLPQTPEHEQFIAEATSDLVDADEALHQSAESHLPPTPLLLANIIDVQTRFRALLEMMPPAANRLIFADCARIMKGTADQVFTILGRVSIPMGDSGISLPGGSDLTIYAMDVPEGVGEKYARMETGAGIVITVAREHFPEDGIPVAPHEFFDGIHDVTDNTDEEDNPE